jgi:hypothetical protein
VISTSLNAPLKAPDLVASTAAGACWNARAILVILLLRCAKGRDVPVSVARVGSGPAAHAEKPDPNRLVVVAIHLDWCQDLPISKVGLREAGGAVPEWRGSARVRRFRQAGVNDQETRGRQSYNTNG